MSRKKNRFPKARTGWACRTCGSYTNHGQTCLVCRLKQEPQYVEREGQS